MGKGRCKFLLSPDLVLQLLHLSAHRICHPIEILRKPSDLILTFDLHPRIVLAARKLPCDTRKLLHIPQKTA